MLNSSSSSSSSSLVIIQKYILLATGMQSSVALRDKVIALHEQTDDLDQVAELADTFMTELDKNSDYNSSQTAAAAREWLANIRATDKLLATGIDAIQGLIDSFIDGNVQNKVNAKNGDGNKTPRRKQRGINYALQSAGFQPAFAPRDGKLNPEEIKSSDEIATTIDGGAGGDDSAAAIPLAVPHSSPPANPPVVAPPSSLSGDDRNILII